MPKKPEDGKLREDANETAYRTLLEAIGEQPKTQPPGERNDENKNPQAVELGRRGGHKGGRARKRRLTAAQRKQIARQGAKKRWSKD